MPRTESIAKNHITIINAFSIYFSSYVLAKIIPTVATTIEKTIPKIKVVVWGISYLMIVPSTKLTKANFAMSINNLPKS